MHSATEIITDTVIGFIILALCLTNFINIIGVLMYETTYGFGTLDEKSSTDVAYTISKDEFTGFSQMHYYMLPVVDTESSRIMYRLDSDGTYEYSEVTGENLISIYNKVLTVMNNTENRGDLEEPSYYLEMDKLGTFKFVKRQDI